MESNHRPLVSIVMNCYNGEKYLRESIDSVYTQTYENWEIIFWDNCSTDNSAKIVKSYNRKLKYYYGHENISLGEARNKALAECKGKYIAFLDTDDVWLARKLEIQISKFDKNDIVLTFTNAKYLYTNGNHYNLYRNNRVFDKQLFPRLLESNIICLSSVMISSEALYKLDEWFNVRFHVSEEYDLFLRLVYRNECSYISGDPLTIYRIHNENLTYNNKSIFAKENEWILDNLLKIHPEILQMYRKNIKINRANIDLIHAMCEFRSNNRKKARRKLIPYLLIKKKFIIPYLFTFCSFKIYRRFLQFFNKQHLI